MPHASAPPAPRSSSQGLQPRPGRLFAAALCSWSALLALPSLVRASEPAYPARSQLRDLQLTTFNCARDNQNDDCDRARFQADGLLDHPRLSGLCKDSLWTISQEAVVAASNSFERRDRLDQAGEDLMRFCPRNPTAPAASGGPPGGGPPGGGFRGGPPGR
ncbi:MAG: hypothetical protein AAFX65_08215 [Cyanobacteria bacterium J06638_7]